MLRVRSTWPAGVPVGRHSNRPRVVLRKLFDCQPGRCTEHSAQYLY